MVMRLPGVDGFRLDAIPFLVEEGGRVLTASSDAVAAYLRHEGDRVVLVVANLGAAPLTGVTLSSEERVLPAGGTR